MRDIESLTLFVDGARKLFYQESHGGVVLGVNDDSSRRGSNRYNTRVQTMVRGGGGESGGGGGGGTRMIWQRLLIEDEDKSDEKRGG